MGKPSDDTWQGIAAGSARVCTVCGRKLKLTDVAEARTTYPVVRRELRCVNCPRWGLSEAERDARTVKATVPPDQRDAVIDRATSRVKTNAVWDAHRDGGDESDHAA